MDLLNRGLTFIPTFHIHKNLKFELEKDIQSYHRRLLLTIHIKDSHQKAKTPFILKSNWTPPTHKIPLEIKELVHKNLEAVKKTL